MLGRRAVRTRMAESRFYYIICEVEYRLHVSQIIEILKQENLPTR
jgi:hypothetical protein